MVKNLVRGLIASVMASVALTAWSAFSQQASKETTEQKGESSKASYQKAVGKLSQSDVEIIKTAMSKGASPGVYAKASDICKSKCKQCFDGKTCDYACVSKTCSGDGGKKPPATTKLTPAVKK